MNSVKVRTTKVSLKEMQLLLHEENITEEADRFLMQCRLSSEFTISLLLPKTLSMRGPDQLDLPSERFADNSGMLVQQLGAQYAHCLAGTAVFQQVMEREMAFTISEIQSATHALVQVRWPINRAPAKPDPRQLAELHALYYTRWEPHEQNTYGMDVFFLPATVLCPEVVEDIAYQSRASEMSLRYRWQVYELEKPFYRAQLERLLQEDSELGERFQIGEDLILDKRRDFPELDLHSELWCNKTGLESLQRYAAANSEAKEIARMVMEFDPDIEGAIIINPATGRSTEIRRGNPPTHSKS